MTPEKNAPRSEEATSPRIPLAAEHVDHLEGLVYSAIEGANLNDPAAPATGGGETPEGAMGAWEYWGNGSYYERGPDGGYSGGYWSSGDDS